MNTGAFVFELGDASFDVTRFGGAYELSRRSEPRPDRPVIACCPEDENVDSGDGEVGAAMTCDSGCSLTKGC